jgi:hypothetical protein
MTRRRHSGTVRPAHFMLAMCAFLSSCAALPDDAPVVEQLDEQTGVTVARLGRPIELYRENFRADATGERFAFFAPFETNNMGDRVPFLLIGLPEERSPSQAPPAVLVNGVAVNLEDPGLGADFAGLRASPYKIPTPWVQMYYYRLDAGLLAQLGEARNLRVEIMEDTRTGPRKVEYYADVGDDSRLREFADR